MDKGIIELLEKARNKKPGDFVRDGTLYDGQKRYCGYLHSVIFQALAKLKAEQPSASKFTADMRLLIEQFDHLSRKYSLEVCDRLDRAEASKAELVAVIWKLNPKHRHDHDYFHKDCTLCGIEKVRYKAIKAAIAQAEKGK